MLFIAFIAVLLAAIFGLIIKTFLSFQMLENYEGSTYRIGWAEYAVTIFTMALVITPAVLFIGTKLSIANIVTYEQFLNGVETQAVDDVTNCRAGRSGGSASSGRSNCEHEYKTGETYTYYTTEMESYPCTDANGKSSTCTRPVMVPHTGYIYHPYATREHRYTIKSSFGFKENEPFTFRGVYLDTDPEPFGSKSIPSSIPTGPPSDWTDAKNHLDRDDPRPVTALDKYDNYILASDDQVLNTYSDDISRFKKAGLLPEHTTKIMTDPVGGSSNRQAEKLSFEGVNVSDKQEWQDALMRFNAALGMELQGDLHVVIVDAARVTSNDAVDYRNALKAYWQGDSFKKRALAKNGIILAIGVSDNTTIEWAESTTGMPFGNELLAQYIRDYLPESDFTPRSLFGEPRTVITGDKAKVTLSSPRGTLEQIVFETAPFERASMSCEGKNEGCVGFKDLLDTIEPTGTQKFLMLIVTTLLAIGLWVIVAMTSFVDDAFTGFTQRFPRNSPSTYPQYEYPPYTRKRGKNKRKEWS